MRKLADKERDFPQKKLDSEINLRFLLNGHGDLYFLLHSNSVHTILLYFKKKKLKKFSERKEDIGERVHETVAWVEFDHFMSKARLPNLTGVFNIAKHRDTEILLWLL